MKKKTLMVVYRKEDKPVFHLLEKLVFATDDTNGKIIGTKDESVSIIGCLEDDWLQKGSNVKNDNKFDKILFIDTQGIKSLQYSIDASFSRYGVKYGFLDNQALLFADPFAFKRISDYRKFEKELGSLIEVKGIADKHKYGDGLDAFFENAAKKGAFTGFLYGLVPLVGQFYLANKIIKDVKHRSQMRTSQLMYGVIKLYFEDLESFMKS